MGKRILLTGGAGLIGSHITDLLLTEEGSSINEIRIFDDFSRGTRANLEWALQDPRVRIVEGDVCDREGVHKAMNGIDYVFHLAAIRITRCATEPRLANDILVNGTFNVLEAAAEHRIDKVIASSSASVYGLADTFPTPETQHPYDNDTIYGAAKAYNEGMLRSFKAMYDLDYIALRYFNVYGPRMDTEGVYTEVLIRWMQSIAEGKAPVIHGDGLATMDFVYVTDVPRANLAAYRSNVTDQVFNVARGEETSLLQLANALLRVMGSDLTPVHEGVRKTNGVSRRLADTSKGLDMLGYWAQVGLDEGLERLVNWWESTRSDDRALEMQR